MRKFDTGATRDVDTNKYDYEGFLAPSVLEAYAEYMHKNRVQADGNLRASDNWQKGIPVDAYMKSMFRHFMEVWSLHRYGGGDHAHMKEALSALLFNVMGYMFETIRAEKAEQFDPVRADAIWRSSFEPKSTEEELQYEDYAPSYHTSLSTLPGMERGEVLGVCPQRTQGEVDAMATEVRCVGCGQAGIHRDCK